MSGVLVSSSHSDRNISVRGRAHRLPCYMGGGFAVGVHQCHDCAAHMVVQQHRAVVATGRDAPKCLDAANIGLGVADVFRFFGCQMDRFDNVLNGWEVEIRIGGPLV
jgi:hypothetical protein